MGNEYTAKVEQFLISRGNRFLETYKSHFSFPVIKAPEFIHGSPKCLIPGDKLNASLNEGHRSNNAYDLEEMFEEIRQKEFPERPGRESSIFLWPVRLNGIHLHNRKFIRPTIRNKKRILDKYMLCRSNVYDPIFIYAARIPEDSNVFYGNCNIVEYLLGPAALVDSRMFNTNLYEMMDKETLREVIRNYWRQDVREGGYAEILVDGDVEIEGIPTFEFGKVA